MSSNPAPQTTSMDRVSHLFVVKVVLLIENKRKEAGDGSFIKQEQQLKFLGLLCLRPQPKITPILRPAGRHTSLLKPNPWNFLVEGDEQLDRPNSQTTMECCHACVT